jgi:geranylgeranyl pyrophosphate synthase
MVRSSNPAGMCPPPEELRTTPPSVFRTFQASSLQEEDTVVATQIGPREDAATTSKKPPRPSTAHLKLVPQDRPTRELIRREAKIIADSLDRSRSLTKMALQHSAEMLLRALGQPDGYLGFTMVMLLNEYWRDQFMATDFKRRLLLLPHCLKHAEGCPADYDELGLECRKCGACSISDFKVTAEDLGYKVLVAEGTPIVLKIIVAGHVDAVLGVACLNVLEKAIDKVLMVGVPSLAIPLLSSDCKSTSVDDDWVTEVLAMHRAVTGPRVRTYLPLIRAANRMFDDDQLGRLAPRLRASNGNGHAVAAAKPSNGSPAPLDPIASTEAIAFDFLKHGGKRFRPFVTLASYDAVTGGAATRMDTQANDVCLPDGVRRAALAIEAFHKASLVHDDIEDDDTYRYGRETLHRQHGLPIALNVGDYLIGLGYRLVGRDNNGVDGDCAADVLGRLADAHMKLSEGQGAELVWRQNAEKSLTPLDTLKIYALKTAPAFEAALYAGLRLGGVADQYKEMIVAFSRHLGVAFQILNDLKDWDGDDNNKLLAGQDALSARPTLLLALALEGATEPQRQKLHALIHSADRTVESVNELRAFFAARGVFDKAEKLVQKYRERAEATADEIEPIELRELLYFLIDTVLEREPAPAPLPEPALPPLATALPVLHHSH